MITVSPLSPPSLIGKSMASNEKCHCGQHELLLKLRLDEQRKQQERQRQRPPKLISQWRQPLVECSIDFCQTKSRRRRGTSKGRSGTQIRASSVASVSSFLSSPSPTTRRTRLLATTTTTERTSTGDLLSPIPINNVSKENNDCTMTNDNNSNNNVKDQRSRNSGRRLAKLDSHSGAQQQQQVIQQERMRRQPHLNGNQMDDAPTTLTLTFIATNLATTTIKKTRISWSLLLAICLLSLTSSYLSYNSIVTEASSLYAPPLSSQQQHLHHLHQTRNVPPFSSSNGHPAATCPALAPPSQSGSFYNGPDTNGGGGGSDGYTNVGGACHPTKDGMLNVHIICHTHLDTGWVETFDQYYYGYVETILNSVVKSLSESPRRRFIFVETAFLMRWWKDQNDYVRQRFKKLVHSGQLEFISGGWSMNDEAVSHYSAIIDQMTLGHKNLYRLFGQCGGIPKIGWQIDPFGHSREYASLLSQMGFDGLFLGRIDFQDKAFRQRLKTMEFIWKSSPSLGAYKSDIFTGILPNTYSPPDNFCYDVNCNDEQLNKYNLKDKALQFSRLMLSQSKYYTTNHTLVTMGMDFNYRDANKWYTNLDVLIDEIQSDPQRYKINILYSTPSCYLKNVQRSPVSWPVKLDDFFPYADAHNSYWTGYFTSRPGLKYQIVTGNNFLQAAKQLSVMANPLTNQDAVNELESLQETLGILQHHDAVTGTCKQFVNDDYSRMLAQSMKRAHHSLVTSVAKIIEHNYIKQQQQQQQQRGGGGASSNLNNNMSLIDMHIMKGEHIFCSSLNASHCQISEKLDRFERLIIHVYNPASQIIQHYVQIPVRDGQYMVREANGAVSSLSQQTLIPPSVLKLTSIESRQEYGIIDPEVTKEFLFSTVLPPLTMATFIVDKIAGVGAGSQQLPSYQNPNLARSLLQANKQIVPSLTNNNVIRRDTGNQMMATDPMFGNSRISAIIDRHTGMMKAIQFGDGRRLTLRQTFQYYDADTKYRPEKNSGAYIFNPSDDGPQKVAPKAEFEIIRGPVVEEVHQIFSPWCSQVIRIYKQSDYIEFHWLVGPIPIGEHQFGSSGQFMADNGREVVATYDTDMHTNETFFTDSNGRETIRRLKNYRSDYRLYTSEHTASNYYPITSWIFIRDYDQNIQLSILPDRPQGASSLRDGQLELMVHRRLLQDDGLGMDEPLNEPGIDRRGLIIRGKHYLLIGAIDNVIRSTRQLSKQLHMQPIQWFQAPPSGAAASMLLAPTTGVSGAGTTANGGYQLETGQVVLNNANSMNRFKFNGLQEFLPKMINLLSLESWDQDHVLIRLEHIFEINEDADYSKPVRISLRRMFKNFRVIKMREMTLDGLQDVELARQNRLKFVTNSNPYKNYTDELGDFVNSDYVMHLENNIEEVPFIILMRPMEIRTFLLQIVYDS